jgi:hypothetical protein
MLGLVFSFCEESYCFLVRDCILARCCNKLTDDLFLCFGDPITALSSLLPFLANEAFLFELLERLQSSGDALEIFEGDLRELRLWLLCLEMLVGSLFWRMTVSRLLIRSKSFFNLSLASTSTTCLGNFAEVGI